MLKRKPIAPNSHADDPDVRADEPAKAMSKFNQGLRRVLDAKKASAKPRTKSGKR